MNNLPEALNINNHLIRVAFRPSRVRSLNNIDGIYNKTFFAFCIFFNKYNEICQETKVEFDENNVDEYENPTTPMKRILNAIHGFYMSQGWSTLKLKISL